MTSDQDLSGLAFIGQRILTSKCHGPLPDLVHVFGKEVVHIFEVLSHEFLLRPGRLLLFLKGDKRWSSTDVPRHGVQDLHGILQLQLLVQRNDTGLSSAVSDKDLTQYSVVELHELVLPVEMTPLSTEILYSCHCVLHQPAVNLYVDCLHIAVCSPYVDELDQRSDTDALKEHCEENDCDCGSDEQRLSTDVVRKSEGQSE